MFLKFVLKKVSMAIMGSFSRRYSSDSMSLPTPHSKPALPSIHNTKHQIFPYCELNLTIRLKKKYLRNVTYDIILMVYLHFDLDVHIANDRIQSQRTEEFKSSIKKSN